MAAYVDLPETDEVRSVRSTLGDRRGAEQALADYPKDERRPQFRRTSRSSPTQLLRRLNLPYQG
jgi:hypothetical protein